MSTVDTGLSIPAGEPEDDGDDIDRELAELAARRRRKLPRLTLVLAVALVGAGAFIGGALAQKHWGSSSSSSGSGNGAAAAFASRFANRGSTAGGSGGASSFFGGATIGSVTAIKGSTLYVTDTSGNTVKVTVGPGVQVTKSVTGTVQSVNAGDTVVVRGTAGKNGVIAAQSVSIGGAGGLGGFGGSSSSGNSANSNGGATGFGGGSSSKGSG
jgi:hypothetical protein